ncbi:hypothetical protein A9Q87_10140 [Flavobacteriales bacterium 34_180_T64]|nr:hypothetical protein A9Q87_10140 [Flavobacteriales bacterium 34_180_T64]
MKYKHVQHLYWRAGFGLTPKQTETLSKLDKTTVVKNLCIESKQFTPLLVDTSELEGINPQIIFKNPKKRKSFFDKSIEKVKALNYEWIERLAHPNELLREKMTLFWANHFVCFDKNIFHVQQFNNTLREHALGDFRDFVKAISKEAAMIKYLNLKQNKKQEPNENFARELLELFTLGMGHYKEEDIQESARAFTGYDFEFNGEFRLKTKQHDYGFKTFFGRMGRYNGDDIIDMILEQEQCARFISEKIYRYFVNDKINSEHIELMVNQFYPNYNIDELMYFVFTSDWFYNEINIGTKIKSPIEYLVGIQQIVPFQFKIPHDVLKVQKLLGQVLLYPPNVSGWKGGQNWIDNNTIMLRLKLPSVFLSNAYISTHEKGDFSDSFKREFKKRGIKNKVFDTIPEWDIFNRYFKEISFDNMSENLLLCPINEGTNQYLNDLSRISKSDFCVQLMSLPEYQMC